MTRDEALKKMQAVKSYMTSGNPIWSVTEIGEAFDMAIEALEKPERKKGKWIPDNTNPYEIRFVCSNCNESQPVPTTGFTSYKPIWDWCPLCGAKMEGEQT